MRPSNPPPAFFVNPALVLCGALLGISCQAILGLDEPSLRVDGGVAAGGNSTVGGAGGDAGTIGGTGGVGGGAGGCTGDLLAVTYGGEGDDRLQAAASLGTAGEFVTAGRFASHSIQFGFEELFNSDGGGSAGGGSPGVDPPLDGVSARHEVSASTIAVDGPLFHYAGIGPQEAVATATRGGTVWVASNFKEQFLLDPPPLAYAAVGTDRNGFVARIPPSPTSPFPAHIHGGASGMVEVTAVAASPNGDVWVAGRYFGTLSGMTNLATSNFTLTPSDTGDQLADGFVLRFTGDPVPTAFVFGSSAFASVNDIAVLANGDVLVGGGFQTDLSLPSGHQVVSQAAVSISQGWVARLPATGALDTWHMGLTTVHYSKVQALAVGSNDEIIVAGAFRYGELTLPSGGSLSPNASVQSSFLLETDGISPVSQSIRWATVLGDTGIPPEVIAVHDIAVGPEQEIVIGGFLKFGDASFGGTLLVGAVEDAFVVRRTAGSNGVYTGAWQVSDVGNSRTEAVAVDGSGQILAVGFFDGSREPGSSTVRGSCTAEQDLTLHGAEDAFVLLRRP